MIKEFRGKHLFLSNFYGVAVSYNGLKFMSSEAAFQAQKCPSMAKSFTRLGPNKAKALGRNVQLREDWEDVKDDIMYDVIKAKFTQNEYIKKQLLDTGDEELVEGNTWNDTYWGVDIRTGKGKNKLGKLLMKLRTELREE